MSQEILEFLKSNRISVLAVGMLDGTPHASTVHYAATEQEPLQFFFKTSRNYRKAEPLLAGQTAKASVVVGFNETEMKTFQADGEVRLASGDELETLREVYYNKFPEKKAATEKPDSIFLTFLPTWWRYTDWGSSTDKKIILSTDQA